MPQEWYYTKGDQKYGPVTVEKLKELAASGQLHQSDHLWQEGMKQWAKAGAVSGLFSEVQAVPPPLPPTTSRQDELNTSPKESSPSSTYQTTNESNTPLDFLTSMSVKDLSNSNASSNRQTITSKIPSRAIMPLCWLGVILFAVAAVWYTYTWDKARRIKSAIAIGGAFWNKGEKDKAVEEYKQVLDSLVAGSDASILYQRVIDYYVGMKDLVSAKIHIKAAKSRGIAVADLEEPTYDKQPKLITTVSNTGNADQGGITKPETSNLNSDERKWGFLDKTGKIVINFQYDDVLPFSQGLCAALRDGKWGYIDKQGYTVIDFQYDTADRFSEGVAFVTKAKERLCIDTKGQKLFTHQFDHCNAFSEGLAVVETSIGKNKNICGVIDKTGAVILKPYSYSEISSFSNGVAIVRYGHGPLETCSYGLIDKSGNLIMEPQNFHIAEFHDGVAIITAGVGSGNGIQWGIINTNGRFVVPLQQQLGFLSFSFSEGLVPFHSNSSRAGYINTNGQIAISLEKVDDV